MKTFFRRVFNVKKKYSHQGFMHLNDLNEPVIGEITDRVKWLETIDVEAYSQKEAEEQIFRLLHFKYPEHKRKILLF